MKRDDRKGKWKGGTITTYPPTFPPYSKAYGPIGNSYFINQVGRHSFFQRFINFIRRFIIPNMNTGNSYLIGILNPISYFVSEKGTPNLYPSYTQATSLVGYYCCPCGYFLSGWIKRRTLILISISLYFLFHIMNPLSLSQSIDWRLAFQRNWFIIHCWG